MKKRMNESMRERENFFCPLIDKLLFVRALYIPRILTLMYVLKTFFSLGNLNHRIDTGKNFCLHH